MRRVLNIVFVIFLIEIIIYFMLSIVVLPSVVLSKSIVQDNLIKKKEQYKNIIKQIEIYKAEYPNLYEKLEAIEQNILFRIKEIDELSNTVNSQNNINKDIKSKYEYTLSNYNDIVIDYEEIFKEVKINNNINYIKEDSIERTKSKIIERRQQKHEIQQDIDVMSEKPFYYEIESVEKLNNRMEPTLHNKNTEYIKVKINIYGCFDGNETFIAQIQTKSGLYLYFDKGTIVTKNFLVNSKSKEYTFKIKPIDKNEMFDFIKFWVKDKPKIESIKQEIKND